MFRSRSNCLGYDRDTPLGELADSARRHWDNIELEFNKRDNCIESMSAQVAILKYRASGLYEENQRMADRFLRKELHHKYKRCLDMVEICRYRKNLDEDKYPSFMHGGHGWTNYRFWDNWQRKWKELADYFKSKASYG